jgi:hypothetical protein
MPSPGAGGYDFGGAAGTDDASAIHWASCALPTVVALTGLPADLANPQFGLPANALRPLTGVGHSDCTIIAHGGATLRVHVDAASGEPAAVVLPFDKLFDIRAAAALQLWRHVSGRALGPDPAALSPARRDRLILGLRALDGRQQQASYRAIADVLFDAGSIPSHVWKTHDLRDRTIRLVRFATGLMQGGYRRLLLHPYRRRS